MKKLKKITVYFACTALLFSLSACGDKKKTENGDGKGSDKRVTDAIVVLSDYWNECYEGRYEGTDKKVEDKYLEITNTTIINIKDTVESEEFSEAIEKFQDIDYIVEFDLRSNYFESSPYHYNVGIANCVMVHKDGTTEVNQNLFNIYRSRTYSSDFSAIIDSIEEFHGEYDRVIELEDKK